MIRSALVAFKPSPEQEYLVDFAVSLAAKHSLQLMGVCIIDEHRLAAPEPVPLGGGAFKTELDLQRLEVARRGAQEATAALTAAASTHGVPLNVDVCEGESAEQVIRHANSVDCLICGHQAGSDVGPRSLLHSILKHSPRPAIVVPDTPYGGSNIVVAYDGSFQASRTLAEFAHSGLDGGQTVNVVSLHQEEQEAARLASEAVSYLQRHEIAAAAHGAALTGKAGQQLLQEVQRLNAGLLVMGAFGHNAVREFLFGSTSHDILSTLPLPVFLDH